MAADVRCVFQIERESESEFDLIISPITVEFQALSLSIVISAQASDNNEIIGLF